MPRVPCPPPFSVEKKQGGGGIKIGQPRSKIQAKTCPQNTLNTLKFSKNNSCEVGGGGAKGPQGERGNMLFIKVIRSRKWKNNARNIILFRCSKALYFHTFSKMFLSKCTLKNIYNTPQIFSGMLKIAPKALHFLRFIGGANPLPSLRRLTPFIIQKKNSCHFYIFIISVYISNVFASLVVQF